MGKILLSKDWSWWEIFDLEKLSPGRKILWEILMGKLSTDEKDCQKDEYWLGMAKISHGGKDEY